MFLHGSRLRRVAVWLVWSAIFATPIHAATVKDLPPTGPPPALLDGNGKRLYANSYALLISAAAYKGPGNRGFRTLPNTTVELDLLTMELQRHGFNVRRVYDPTDTELREAYQKFAATYGRKPDNRLVFVFAGHGYSDNDVGYIVPVNADDPRLDESDFFTKALPVQDIYDMAGGLVRARHALFIFDSCFSGSIFSMRGSPELPSTEVADRSQYLRSRAPLPVRQFITSGMADEEVPAKSIFIPLLIQALEGRASDAKDGYVTGKEIGFWLEQRVPTANPTQHAQSGFIRDPDKSVGDIIFSIPVTPTVPFTPSAPATPGVPTTPTVFLTPPSRSPPPEPPSVLPLPRPSDTDLHNFVQQFLMVACHANANEVLDFYANRVDFYDQRGVDKNYILKDKRYYFHRWPQLQYELAGAVYIDRAGPDGTIVLSYPVRYLARNLERNESKSGIARVELRVRLLGDRLAIVSEREQVFPN